MSVCLIVGCDKGIGRSMALQLHERGETLIAACLGDSEELRSLGIQVEPNVDVCDDASVKAMAKRLKDAGTKVDVLVNVAGVIGVDKLGEIDYDDVRRQFEINTIGPLRVVESLLESLGDGSKVGIITSRVGSINDNESGGLYAYRISKCAANMVGVNLYHDLKERGIAVVLLHPGMVNTDLTRGFDGEFIEPEESAAGLIKVVDNAKIGNGPEFRHSNGELLPW
jgi:NAD(P)-dependent dehydrogenase (short-subunit alcohol dehydrogenase family)